MVIPALMRLRQGDGFKDSLGYTVSVSKEKTIIV
jgi:hypothetical protein